MSASNVPGDSAKGSDEVMKHAAKAGGNTLLYSLVAIAVVAVVIVGALWASGAFNGPKTKTTTTTTTISNPSISTFSASPSKIAEGGTTYFNATVTGGYSPYTYAYTGLPSGCASANTNSLKCVPTASGSFTVVVTVTDVNGTTASGSAALVVVAGVAITSFSAIPATITVGSSATFIVQATGGTPPYTYSYTGLPAGCTSASTSELNCTPSGAGVSTVTVFVNDTNHLSNSAHTSLTVNPPGADTLAITSFTAAPATLAVNATTTLSVAANGGYTPYTYAYTGLPTGCTSSNTDVLACTPNEPGTFEIQVAVTDAHSFSKLADVNISVTAPVNCAIPSGQTVTGSGSTFVNPLVETWESAYTNSTVSYDAVGSGTGIANIQALTYDFGATDAPLSATQVKATTAGQLLTIPWSSGAVTSIYNLGGQVSSLKVDGAWEYDVWTGAITNWNSSVLQTVNPGVVLPNDTITLVHRSDGSGTSYVFQQWLSQENATWAKDYGYSTTWVGPAVSGEQAEHGSSGVAQYVAGHEYSLSYVDLTYVLTTTGIAAAAVENPKGKFITPTINDTENAIHNITSQPGFTFPNATNYDGWQNVSMLNSPGINDYPIATFTYILVYEHPDQVGYASSVMTQDIAKALWQFINWATTSSGGQAYSTGDYFVPLAATVQALDKLSINEMTWGGQPVYPAGCDA